ncbi:hypothetical protein GIB67_006701 [Kingdonia uniflora]|uniref:AB hydrolase-1 domain-containing protein n=1 Tax=Kingdonia uniflora TaxID=39325 RepID=A0A7J7LYX9_9MAGN|nr:hypothetical protein GIB67_006701 [Kingdonia uniflora]
MKSWRASQCLISAISFIVFVFLDLLDLLLCHFYRFIDGFMGEDISTCYCHKTRGKKARFGVEEGLVSKTLYGRKNFFRGVGILNFRRNEVGITPMVKSSNSSTRWSDCNCESCVSWQQSGELNLHVVVKEPSPDTNEDCTEKPTENVIFLHGFLASSSFWSETIFPTPFEAAKQSYRFFAVDLLGFGRSPKPRECLYTLKDHVEMVEKSVINQFQLDTFHIVAHSMGCIIGLALAAKYKKTVKSITLVAPPYFPSSNKEASVAVLNKLAERRIWPPLLFGTSIMSWDLHFMFKDMTRHTHHSAWHTMHNVICGGSVLVDNYLEAVDNARVEITVIQGDKDQVVPLECSHNLKLKVPRAKVTIISNSNHSTVIIGREEHFMSSLEQVWSSAVENHKLKNIQVEI